MPKPSVLQKFLNQPSQSYTFPTSKSPSVKQYHSTKAQLVRVAAGSEEEVGVSADSGYAPKNIPNIPDIVIFGSSPRRGFVREDVIPADSLPRNRSARPSHYSGVAPDSQPQIHQPSGDRVTYDGIPQGHRDSDSGSSDSENEVYYTPVSSPYNSPHTSMALSDTALVIPPVPISVPPRPIPEPQQPSLAAFTFPRRAIPSGALLSTKTNSEANGRRSYTYSSSSSSDSDEEASIFSSSTSPMSASTQITTPPQSISGRKQSLQRRGTISSTSSGSAATMVAVQSELSRSKGQGHKRTQSVGAGPGTRPEAKDSRIPVYTDKKWARDVRWLQNGEQSNGIVNLSTATGTRSRSSSTASSTSSKGKGKLKDTGYAYHTWDRDERERMSAVMEEDEDDLSTIGNRNSNYSNRSRNRGRTQSTPSTSQLRASHTIHGALSSNSSSHGGEIPRSQMQAHRPAASVSGHSHAHSYTQSHTTRALPTPIPASSSGTSTHTYTGLVLPRAGQGLTPEKTLLGTKKKNKEFTGGGGKVDLTQSGMATTTMATVEVVKGVAGALSKKRNIFKRGNSKDEGSFRAHVPESETPLALTSHLPPPSYVPSNCVLVQVWAAGLDSVDDRLVREVVSDVGGGKGGKAVGYVPGRSLVGRAVEVGSSVREDTCRRSDWVVGMLDVRKCGALAEFVLVERHRLHRVPPPPAPGQNEHTSLSRSSSYRSHYSRSSRSESQSPSGSRTSHTRSQSLSSTPTYINVRAQSYAQMTIEELALLPVVGVPAYRVLRTFERVIELRRVVESEGNLARKRALILRGHDGVGAMVTQMLARRGVDVSVFVPGAVIDVGDRQGEVDLNESVEEKMLEIEKRLRGWGAEEILWGTATRGDGRDRDEVLEVVQRLAEGGEEFDMVLDTIGGRDVWMACKTILGGGAGLSASQFTTLVGDLIERVVPTAQDHFWAGLRSMGLSRGGSVKKKGQAGEKVAAALVGGSPSISTKGSGKSSGKGSVREKPKEKKEIGYAWVSVSADVDMEGEDVADTMNALLRMIKGSDIRPWAGQTDVDAYDETSLENKKVLPFERAPELFSSGSSLRDGGTAVVKIAA
ncbi:hypothetical protein OE88DRAFT_1652920 [Heliocybe sulcata]|uniref:Uncharacterized protein n=1 Tax=Heliocybe sulcata TaxID=5364 RepID=A0A5C3NIF5_9AGAM|nr:hypothetical protein OE88DRAFT_1652920 [Heliocybe sulcata]